MRPWSGAVTLVLLLWSAVTSSGTATGQPVATRDAVTWPFRADSIWNTPVGSGATYVPAGLRAAAVAGMTVDENILVLTKDAPVVPVYANAVGWTAGARRCDGITGQVLLSAPVPTSFVTDPGYLGATPNMPGALLMADGFTLKQTQPLHRCADGRVTSQYLFPDDNIRTGTGLQGAHGGSGMSSLGGTVRVGELQPGSTIRHALKFEVDAAQYLSAAADGTTGFRWPASASDSYSIGGYRGTNGAMQMGSLLAVPPSFDISSLQSEPARILATAFRDYGAYIVDDTARDVYAIATEWGPNGRVIDDFQKTYGFAMETGVTAGCTGDDASCAWAKDMAKIVESLQVVDNNTPTTIGGPGTRRAACAPDFAGVPASRLPTCGDEAARAAALSAVTTPPKATATTKKPVTSATAAPEATTAPADACSARLRTTSASLRGATVVATSQVFPAVAVIDGSSCLDQNRWISAPADGQSIEITLAAPKLVRKLSIVWDRSSAASYLVQVRTSGGPWRTVATVRSSKPPTGAYVVTHTFNAPATAAIRLVQMARTAEAAANGWGISIREIGVLP